MKKKQSSSNTKFAFLFFIFITFIVLSSLIYKGITLVKESRFSNHRFTVGITNGKNYTFFSFSPKSRQISVLRIKEGIGSTNLQKILAVYADGHIALDLIKKDEGVASVLWKTLLNFNRAKTNLGVVDLIKLLIFTKTVSASDILARNISLAATTFEIDKLAVSLLTDREVAKDNKTVEIINGTDVAGLGSFLARLLGNVGFNVVLVSTSDKEERVSAIYYSGKNTYSAEKLSKMFGFKTLQKEEGRIADIVILVGKDSLARLGFLD